MQEINESEKNLVGVPPEGHRLPHIPYQHLAITSNGQELVGGTIIVLLT